MRIYLLKKQGEEAFIFFQKFKKSERK